MHTRSQLTAIIAVIVDEGQLFKLKTFLSALLFPSRRQKIHFFLAMLQFMLSFRMNFKTWHF